MVPSTGHDSGQPFGGAEDLLHDDQAVGPDHGAEPVQVLLGVDQPVDVVDPHPLHDPRGQVVLGQPLPQQGVHVGEHRGAIDPHRGQVGDVEEATPVEQRGPLSPVHRPPVLGIEEGGHRSGGPVQALDGAVDPLLAVTRAQPQHRQRPVRGRPHVAAVAHLELERLGPAPNPQGPVGQGLLEGAVEEGQHHLPGREGVGWVPVDVEVAGVAAVGPASEHVLPPAVRGVADAHVVGDEVDHHAHAVVVEGAPQPPERRLPTELVAHHAGGR